MNKHLTGTGTSVLTLGTALFGGIVFTIVHSSHLITPNESEHTSILSHNKVVNCIEEDTRK